MKRKIEKLRTEEFELFDQITITRYNLDEYKQTEEKLWNYGLSLNEDTEKILNFLENLNEYGGDTNEAVKVLGNIKDCNDYYRNLQLKVSDLRSTLKREGTELQLVEQKLSSGNQLLSQYKELEKIGIGLSDLKSIRNIVVDIA
jgi:hypothetical protein